jgi:hypothetical protein
MIDELAIVMRILKDGKASPLVLLLGSDAGAIPIDELQNDYMLQNGGAHSEGFAAMDAETRAAEFRRTWSRCPSDVRRAYLPDALSRVAVPHGRRIAGLQEGYSALAELVELGYFSVIFTADVSTLLEDALAGVGLRRRASQVFVNGRDAVIAVDEGLRSLDGHVKVVKLHGDGALRILPLGAQDVFDVGQDVQAFVKGYLARPLLVVGHRAQDTDVSRCIPSANDGLYYVCEAAPAPGTLIMDAIGQLEDRVLSGEAGGFTPFFTALRRKLLGSASTGGAAPEAADAVDAPATAVDSGPAVANPVEWISDLVEFGPTAPAAAEDLLAVVGSTNIIFRCDPRDGLSFRIEGRLTVDGGRSVSVDFGVDAQNQHMQNLARNILMYHENGDEEGRKSWRLEASITGKRLYNDLLKPNSDLMHWLGRAEAAAGSEEDLGLCFGGPREHLGMPYELLRDEVGPLALRHPICRQVTGVANAKTFSGLLSELRRSGDPLRVLLIASDTGGIQADEEVAALQASIDAKTRELRIRAKITPVFTDDASLGYVTELLRNERFHIVHFAGHAQFDPTAPESSSLLFWERQNRQGEVKHLTGLQLRHCLDASPPLMLYVSSCSGATVGGGHLLDQNDYLGIMDAAVQAGVPVVFGYRWYVTDAGARRFACLFYESLFTTQSPTRAVLHARKTMYCDYPNDETWTSPVLVVQKL